MSPQKRRKVSKVDRLLEFQEQVGGFLPSFSSWFLSEDDFRGLILKVKADGTTLAVAKGYDSDGAPIVSFGAGYGPIMALVALDASIQGGNWRVDKPWDPNSS